MTTELIEIIKDAGKIACSNFYNSFSVEEKDPNDLVTNVDKEIELFIKKSIKEKYPDSSFYGEETGYENNQSDHLFVIDPIDGTANFIFGVPYFSISIAEMKFNNVVNAIVYNPISNDLFYANENDVAQLNNNEIKVSDRNRIEETYAVLGFSANSKNILRYQNEWSQMFTHTKKTLPLLSPSLNLCSVAMGKTDIFIDFGCSFEGQVAGAFILERAGGVIRNYEDQEYDYRKIGIVATNGNVEI